MDMDPAGEREMPRTGFVGSVMMRPCVPRRKQWTKTRCRGEGGVHVNSLPVLSGQSVASSETFPFSLPTSVQAPGLPFPFHHLPPVGGSMPRASSKVSRHDDQSPGRVSSGMQTTSVQHSGLGSGRHPHDSARHMAASKQGLEYRQNGDAGDTRCVEHSVRPSVRKPHRQPRDFPFQEEFEPTFSGQKEKRINVAGLRHDKDSPYCNPKQPVDKSHKDICHRMQFQNVELPYQKQKKDSNYFEPKHEKEVMYASRRVESYGSSRVDRDARYVNAKHDREPCAPATRRGRESPYCIQRQENHRSSSTDSSQSSGSPYADRDSSPHLGSSPSMGYHSQSMQPYMFDSRNHSGDRDTCLSKHRDNSGERYLQSIGSFPSTALRQSLDTFSESMPRDVPRENSFNPSTYTNDSQLHSKTVYSGRPDKTNKTGHLHGPYTPSGSGDNMPGQRIFSYASHPETRQVSGPEPQADTVTCMDLPLKKPSDQGNRGRNDSAERMFSRQPDRDKTSNRKKQTSRNQHCDLQMPIQTMQQSSYFPASPCYVGSCTSDVPSDSVCVSIRGSSKPCEEDCSTFRTAKQQTPDHRPVRSRRPSTPSSPSPPPYASKPATPPLYSSRPSSPPSFSSKRSSSKQQLLQESQEGDPCRWPSVLSQGVDSDCSSSAAAVSQTSCTAPHFNQSKRRRKEADDSPELTEPPPLIEPMAFQQQFIKHLQQQGQQEGEEEQFRQSFPLKVGKHGDDRRPYEDKKQQRVREQTAKQEEQMCQEYIKMAHEKLQRQHQRQLQDLQMEHMQQIEHMHREHMAQMQRQMPRDQGKNQSQIQGERFAEDEVRLQREQMKQFQKMRQDQMKEYEKTSQELMQLQQKYVDREPTEIQENGRREQQELTQYQYQQMSAQNKCQHQSNPQPSRTQSRDEDCADAGQRQPPDFAKHCYVQVNKQQGQLYQQQPEIQKPAECPQKSSGHEYQSRHKSYPQQQLAHENSPHPIPHHFQHQFQETHNSSHHQQQRQYPQSSHQTTSEQTTPGQWQQVYVQQDHLPRLEVQDDCQQSACHSRTSRHGQTTTFIQHTSSLAPVPPWRQASVGRDASGNGPTEGGCTVSPGAQLSGNQSVRPTRQAAAGRQCADKALPLKPLQQTPFSHSGHTMPSISSSAQLTMPSVNSTTTEVQATFQTHYSTQSAFNHSVRTETGHHLEAYRSAPIAGQPGSTAKKPPWLVDHENQVLCTQKKPPWQQQSEHLFVIPSQDTVARSVSQYAVSGAASTGHQYPKAMCAPPPLTRLTPATHVQTPEHLTGIDISHPSIITQHTQNTGKYQIPCTASSMDFQTSYGGLQIYSSCSQSTAPSVLCSQPVLPQSSVSSAGQHYTHVSSQEQIRTSLSAAGNQPKSQNIQMFPGYSSTEDTPKLPIDLSNGLNKASDMCNPYQTPTDPLGTPGYQTLTGAPTDQECAEQVLVEALNEQMNQSNSQANNMQSVEQASISVEMHSKQTVASTPHHQHQTPEIQTYTLHHLFDDANKNQHCLQPSHTMHQQSATCVVIPDNPLDVAVALLNIPESVLDIPSVEQHQVFVLEPPSRQQATHVTGAALRRNSWHTPENSIAGSRSGSLGDDDAGFFNDISVDLADDDDDLFLPPKSLPVALLDSKLLLHNSVNISSTGISDLGLRISSVFSLAAGGRRKRRTMSDSVLQDVEVMARQETLCDPRPATSALVNKGSSSQQNLSQDLFQLHDNSETHMKEVYREHKCNIVDNGGSRWSPDPLAQLTKMLFSDVPSPAPETEPVEDWNLKEAAGVSFEADSVCVPGTPLRGDPESLVTPLPHLYTPMPQVGTPRPHCIRDPAIPFPRFSSTSQSVKRPTTLGYTLEAAAIHVRKPASSACLKDLKEPQTPWPFPMKEFKEADSLPPSCAIELPNPFPDISVKSKDPSFPLSECAQNSFEFEQSSKTSLLASQVNSSNTSDSQPGEGVLEIRVGDFQRVISENVERASKQPLEQAIRELLGDEPIEKVSEKSFKEVTNEFSVSKHVPKQYDASSAKGNFHNSGNAGSVSRQSDGSECAESNRRHKGSNGKTDDTKSDKREQMETSSRQPQRKSERLSTKEATPTNKKRSKCCATVNTERPAIQDERDIRDRVSDNWERRCVSKTIGSPTKAISSRSRDNSRESDKERRMVPLLPETVNRLTQKSKPSFPKFVSNNADMTEDDRKSCGVRGRRTITISSKRKIVLDRQGSTEEESAVQRQSPDNSMSQKPDGVESMSEDVAVAEEDNRADCSKEAAASGQEAAMDDVDDDVFFPDLSPSISTDGSGAEDEVKNCDTKGRRLSSWDSEGSGPPSVGHGSQNLGEDIADLILPTILPPPHHSRKNKQIEADSQDLLATFHDHKLQCVQKDGEHYVVLEELMVKCFPGLPRSQVELARVHELNLVTHTMDVLGMGRQAVTVMALQNASRLLHYFHARMNCPSNNCKLSTYTSKHPKDDRKSDSGKLRTPCVGKGQCDAGVQKSATFGFVCPGGEEKKCVSAEKSRKNSARDEDGVFVDSDVQDDTRSSSSDQTLPYCDGQPFVGWELDSARKDSNDNSDGEHEICHEISSNRLEKKFRRHSSESEPRIRKLRDSDHVHRGHVLTSMDTGVHGEASPMLPPMPTYASPFTPGSVYNVPMDNERVLLECFSAPASQAPSSVRSAPSVRLLSPDRHDHSHMEEDVFAGLYNKSVSDTDGIIARTNGHTRQQALSALTQGDSEQCADDGKVKKAASADDHYQDCRNNFHAEEPDDHVFMINDTACKQDEPQDMAFTCQGPQTKVNSCSQHAAPPIDTWHSNTGHTSQCVKDVSVPSPQTTVTSQKDQEMVVNYVMIPSARLCMVQPCHVENITPEKTDFKSIRTGHQREQFDKELHEKLSKITSKKSEADSKSKHAFQPPLCVVGESEHEKNLDSSNTNSAEGVCGNPIDKCDTCAVPVKSVSEQSMNSNAPSSCQDKMNPAEESDIPEDKTTSDATFAYGGSDEDADMQFADGPDRQRSDDPPKRNSSQRSGQAHLPSHPSSLSVELEVCEYTLEPQIEDRHTAGLLDEEWSDTRPPVESAGSVEDRVQTFIAHTPRTVVRSNSLPALCGLDNIPSPVKPSEEDGLHFPGAITARCNSFPGTTETDRDLQSCAPVSVAAVQDDFDREDGITDSFLPSVSAVSSQCVADRKQSTRSAPSDQNTDSVFADPGSMRDGGQVVSRATPRRSPEGGGDSEQLLQWAVPCALHGSALCACEGIDVHTAQDVASPRVGPWLCTPGTPMPPTPFTDCSRLVYSPFPVLGGMTPARAEAQDTPVGSPREHTPDLDVYSSGSKRIAQHHAQHVSKRRSTLASALGHKTSSAMWADTPSAHVGCVEEDPAADSASCRRIPTHNENASSAQDANQLDLQFEEQELIAAVDKSDKSMANLLLESREKLLTTSPEIFATIPNASAVSNDPVHSDRGHTDTHSVDTHTTPKMAHNIPGADWKSIDDSVFSTQSDKTTFATAVLETQCYSNLPPENNTSNLAADSKTCISQDCTGKASTTEAAELDLKVHTSRVRDRTIRTEAAAKSEQEIVSGKSGTADPAACPETLACTETCDTNSVGTTDNESVNDLRIIALADSDMDLTFESEDSKDSAETTLSHTEPEQVSKQPTPDSKKIITIAQYKERRKQLAENKTVVGANVEASFTSLSSCPAVSESRNTSTPQERQAVAVGKPTAPSPADCALSLKRTLIEHVVVSKVQRTESVPAELSRKVSSVELKRSSSCHGQHPASKRSRNERDESPDTVKARLMNVTHVRRLGGKDADSGHDGKSALSQPPTEIPLKVRDTTASSMKYEQSPVKRKPADSGDRANKEARKDSAHSERKTSEHRRNHDADKWDSGSSKRDLGTRADLGVSGTLSNAVPHSSQLTTVTACNMDRSLIAQCPQILKPCSVVVSKISSLSVTSSKLKDNSSDDEEEHNSDAIHVKLETISIGCNKNEMSSDLSGPPASHVAQLAAKAQLFAESRQLSHVQDDDLPPASKNTRHRLCSENDRMSVGDSDDHSEEIDVDEESGQEGNDNEYWLVAASSARTRGLCVQKPAPACSTGPDDTISSPNEQPPHSPATSGSSKVWADARSQKESSRAERCAAVLTKGDAEPPSGQDTTHSPHRQLSDQLEALLREKEIMLAEFAQRNRELEQKLEGLREELLGSKKKDD